MTTSVILNDVRHLPDLKTSGVTVQKCLALCYFPPTNSSPNRDDGLANAIAEWNF